MWKCFLLPRIVFAVPDLFCTSMLEVPASGTAASYRKAPPMRGFSIRRLLQLFVLALIPVGCGKEPPAPQTPAKPEDVWADHTQGLPFVIGYEEGLSKARSEGKPAMMFVTATWCGWCRRLAEDSFNDPEIRRLLENFVCVIVDGDREADAKKELDATEGYPIVVFSTPEGSELARCTGYEPADKFKQIVERALASARPATP